LINDQVCNRVGSRSEVIDEENGEEWIRCDSGQKEQQHLSIVYKQQKKMQREKKKQRWVMSKCRIRRHTTTKEGERENMRMVIECLW
jgi:hypothetical protein